LSSQGDPQRLFPFSFSGGIEIPLETDKPLFSSGSTGMLTGMLTIPGLSPLCATGKIAYSYIPVRADTSLSVVSTGIGPGMVFGFTPRLYATTTLLAGGHFASLNTRVVDPEGIPYWPQSGGGMSVMAGTGISFFLSPCMSLGVDVNYTAHLGLYQSLKFYLGASFHIDGLTRKLILEPVRLEHIFPGLYKVYTKEPVGTILLRNRERFSMEQVQVLLYNEHYMDKPTLCGTISELEPGAEKEIDLKALFSGRILDLEESAILPFTVSIEYSLSGRKYRTESTQKIRLYNRNAITWDDDRKISAFIGTADPEILRLARFAAGNATRMGQNTFNRNFMTAMAIFETLLERNLKYVVDPNSISYEEAAGNPLAVDYLQYPIQTLKYNAGDCDDLTILYCSLLESVGIKTAVITTPRHILMAFALDMDESAARKLIRNTGNLIFRDEDTWVPVECTELKSSFLEAWAKGARQWNEHSVKRSVDFIPVAEAWKSYESSGYLPGVIELRLPSEMTIADRIDRSFARFIALELDPWVKEFESIAAEQQDPSKTLNRIGMLYIRYGLHEQAKQTFQSILTRNDYLPSIINLANLYFLDNNYEKAFQYYRKAEEISGRNISPSVLLQLARTTSELGDRNRTGEYLALLRQKDDSLAEANIHLAAIDVQGSGARASSSVDTFDLLPWLGEWAE
jgi:tetratricopeptide (TPR) repeat protein